MAIVAALYPAGPSVPLADHRRVGRHPRRPHRRRARVLSALLSPGATRRSRWRATSTPRRASRWPNGTSPRFPAATRPDRCSVTPSRRRPRRTCGWCSRIAWSCRGSTWRGTRRRSSRTAMRSWIWSATCCRAARRRACIARSSTSSGSPRRSRPRRTRASSAASSRSSPPPRRAGRWPKWSAPSRRRSRPSSIAARRAAELERCLAQAEAHFLFRLQTVGGFGGKSDQLNAYNMFLGDPGYFEKDLERYRAATRRAAAAAAATWLQPDTRVVLSVVPRGRWPWRSTDSRPVAVS